MLISCLIHTALEAWLEGKSRTNTAGPVCLRAKDGIRFIQLALGGIPQDLQTEPKHPEQEKSCAALDAVFACAKEKSYKAVDAELRQLMQPLEQLAEKDPLPRDAIDPEQVRATARFFQELYAQYEERKEAKRFREGHPYFFEDDE